MNEIIENIVEYFDEFLPAAFLVLDKEGKILHCSYNAYKNFNFLSKDQVNKKFQHLLTQESKDLFDKFLSTIHLDPDKNHEVRLVIEDEKTNTNIRLNAARVNDKKNDIFYNLIVIEDVSELSSISSNFFELNQSFKELQSSAHVGLWKYEVESQKLTLSDEIYHIYKLGLGKEVSLTQMIEFFYPYDREKFQDVYELCLFEGEKFCKELRIIANANDLKWVKIIGDPIYNGDEIIGVYGSIQDVTELKNLEYNLSLETHSAWQYKHILDSFAIVAKTDVNGKINYVNDKFCEISKYEERELLGQDHRILNSGHHSKEFFREMWHQIKSGKPWRGEIQNKAKDGSIYWVNTYVTPIIDKSGSCLGFMAIRFDITHEKELEVKLEQERERATISAQLASVGEMSTGIVHEINNPLSVIAGMNALLPKKITDEKALLKIHKSISNAIERMYYIIKGLKRLSHKSDQEKFELVPLIDLLEDSLGFIKESLRHHQIEFKLGDMPYDVLLECREVEISQVLLNLVNNARDAIIEAQIEDKWIDVSFENLDNIILIKVTDSGPGIPEELQDKIMEQFFTTKKVGKGTGLGLSLSARILTDHGGRLYLDKNSRRTTFVMELPKKLDAMAS